uniref:TonB-dependent siderophore receptor n=1 Tax=uncultured Sphingomonas sp. TaxID=158754 RepID=UPI0035CACAA0
MKSLMRHLLSGVAIASVAVGPHAANAQAAGASRETTFAIPAQRLSDALQQLAEVSGLQLIYDTKITDGKASPGVSGPMSGRAALAAVLAGSGLQFQFSGDRTVIITAAGVSGGGDDGVRSVGVVSVEGASGNMPSGDLASPLNGTNGSRDVQATEGTGSYTTGAASVATKMPTTLRETPQSVSVVTSQQIQDQNLVSIRDALSVMPGVTASNGATGEEYNIISRGFKVQTYSFDGGGPVNFNFNNRPVLDMSQYDSVQLIRGANGNFGSYDDPGGTVNLVRKKPLDHRQFSFEQLGGSWDNFRSELDVTGPLTSDGKLRARFVAAREDRNFFYEIANRHKTSIYGILEYDLSPTTLVSVGGNYIRENNLPNQSGLPRYHSGEDINWPIATCLCAPFDYDHAKRREAFLLLEQKITDRIAMKLNVDYNNQSVDALYDGVSADIFLDGKSNAELGGFGSYNPTKQYSADLTVNGSFDLLGGKHAFVVGANYNISDGSGATLFYPTSQPIKDIFHFDPYAYQLGTLSKPDVTLRNLFHSYQIYATIRPEITDKLHLNIGERYSGFLQQSATKSSYDGSVYAPGDLDDHRFSRPSVGATWDVLKHFTVYGSYQTIYQPQYGIRGVLVDKTPPPITGWNVEGGIKWEAPDHRFNGALSVFDIAQNGILQQDYSKPNSVSQAPVDYISRGAELEMSGQIMPHLQATLSYTYNYNRASVYGTDRPITTFTPKHLVKSWIIYRGDDGALKNVTIGGGANYMSDSYNSATICTTSSTPCPFFGAKYFPIYFVTKAYVTAAAKVGYKLSSHVDLSVNVNNITNVKRFLSSNGRSTFAYNFYLEPRNFLASLRMVW